MLARKTSKQYWPMASSFLNPVMLSAALLKDVMRLFESMVKTPSLMLSKMIQQGDRETDVISQPITSAFILSGKLPRRVEGMRRSHPPVEKRLGLFQP
jgi:hypothetical protein